MSVVFRQFFDEDSNTLTYLLADALTGDAVLIDTVREHIGAYTTLLQELDLQLIWVLETHVHADHASAADGLRELTGARCVVGARAGCPHADLRVGEGEVVVFGHEFLRVIQTPGHTDGCVSYLWRDRVFTGDALMIGGCGRTDYPDSDAGVLFDSVTERLLKLPDETLVYPAHNYEGKRVSSIAQEKAGNLRFSHVSKAQFVDGMNALNLPQPRAVDVQQAPVPHHHACEKDLIDVQQV